MMSGYIAGEWRVSINNNKGVVLLTYIMATSHIMSLHYQ